MDSGDLPKLWHSIKKFNVYNKEEISKRKKNWKYHIILIKTENGMKNLKFSAFFFLKVNKKISLHTESVKKVSVKFVNIFLKKYKSWPLLRMSSVFLALTPTPGKGVMDDAVRFPYCFLIFLSMKMKPQKLSWFHVEKRLHIPNFDLHFKRKFVTPLHIVFLFFVVVLG